MSRRARYRSRRSWRSAATVLAAIVVFCTTYALILPAITMEKQPTCGMEEHTHDQGCYGVEKAFSCVPHEHSAQCFDGEGKRICAMAHFWVHTHNEDCYLESGALICSLPQIAAHIHTEECMQSETTVHHHTHDCLIRERGERICTLEESEGHTHDDGCREETVSLICGLEEGEGHVHGSGCSEEQTSLVCTLPESEEHTHGEDCWLTQTVLTCTIPESEGHTHGDDCSQTESHLICGLEEDAGHTHGDDCYAWTDSLICGLEEGQETVSEPVQVCTLEEIILHTHSDGCYGEDGTLDCGMLQITEHVHGEDCVMASGDAQLICTRTEHVHDPVLCYIDPEADVETAAQWEAALPKTLSGIWAEDLLTVAESQIGYTESQYNVQVDAEGFVRGYTRYGAWYGEPYSDWNSIFVSFCLNYAKIGREAFAYESNAQRWINVLSVREQFTAVGEYTPVPGDLVFMDLDDNGYGDTVAIVKNLGDHQLTVIQGDTETGSVEQISYTLSDVPVEGEKVLLPGDILGYGILPENPASGEETTEAAGTEAAETEPYEAVQQVIGEIDTLPAPEEIDAAVDAFEAQEDDSGLEVWYTEVSARVKEAYGHYSALTEEEKAAVTNADKLMQLQFIWAADTLEEPVEPQEQIVNDQESALGVFYQMKAKPYYYQASSHLVNNKACLLFALVPDSVVSGPTEEWTASPTAWSAKTAANYVVAYCSEPYTDSSSSGATYHSFKIDNSRFTDEEQRRRISGILSHAYPYLTESEMRAELAAAYAAGELSCDVASCPQCTGYEYIAAVQAALWELIDASQNYSSYTGRTIIAGSSYYVNPFPEGTATHEAGAELTAHCNAVKEWLLTKIVPKKLAAASYTYGIEEGEYGTYNLTVYTQLNRQTLANEYVTMQLKAGSLETEAVILPAGTQEYSLTIENITERELLNAKIALNVSGQHMQAYFLESGTYQDMISARWEYYSDDISFELGVETTDVSVTKIWSEGAPAGIDSVAVQLYADGTPCGELVSLTAQTGWYHTWSNLAKYDVLGNEIDYTVQEVQLNGYYSSVEKVSSSGSTVQVDAWVASEGFREGNRYLIVSSDGALGVHKFSGRLGLTWEYVDLSDTTNTDESLIWTASALNEAGGALLATLTYPDNPLGICTDSTDVYPEGSLTAAATQVYYRDHHLYLYDGSGNIRYFRALYDNGQYRTTSTETGAGYITVYELQQVELPASEISYVIVNTKIREDIPLINVSVSKQWAGRPDEVYPETAEVQLLQNGREYDVPVTLNEENGWQYQWMGLPKTDNDGNTFVYTVTETGHEDYTPTQEGTWLEDGTYAIALTNTWEPEKVTVELRKADLYSGALIDGAEFDLYLATNDQGDPIPGTEDIPGILLESVSMNEEGVAQLELVCDEVYYLVETKAPAGYVLPTQAIGFTVSQRGTLVTITLLAEEKWVQTKADTVAVITVLNRADYKLPKTGGTGTILYTMGGLLLMASAGMLLMYSQRKRRKGEY